jgi:hypothetical protein
MQDSVLSPPIPLLGARLVLRLQAVALEQPTREEETEPEYAVEGPEPDPEDAAADSQADLEDVADESSDPDIEVEPPIVQFTDISDVRCLDMGECEDLIYTLAHELGLSSVPVGDYILATSLEGLEIVEVPDQWGEEGRAAIVARFPVDARSLQQRLIHSLVAWPLEASITEAAKTIFMGALSIVVEHLGAGEPLFQDFLTVGPLSSRRAGSLEMAQSLSDGIMAITSQVDRRSASMVVEPFCWRPGPVGDWLNVALAASIQGVIEVNKEAWAAEWLSIDDERLQRAREDADALLQQAADRNGSVRTLFASHQPVEPNATSDTEPDVDPDPVPAPVPDNGQAPQPAA